MALRKFNIGSVGFRTSIEEFNVGDHITFYDEYTNEQGSGIIYSFAEASGQPLCWYRSDIDNSLKCVHLGWCRKE